MGIWIDDANGNKAEKLSNKQAGDQACPGSSVVEHQPRLPRVPGSVPDWGVCDFSVSAKASPPISISPFLCVSLAIRHHAAHQSGHLDAILVIFGHSTLFFVWKLLKNLKMTPFCAHAQWWSPCGCKNVEKRHLALSNLTFSRIAVEKKGFRRTQEDGQIYKFLPQSF